ncbi:hypothetical protein FVE85_5800 [Porphyridium purpureum]|uniref:Uncharacterized protein n=1 Tax=Porphyridium purpureum TaxID=35688 RepID=A0A5J4Z4F8_PORPP|nr:hypothetical protein FVE85_5800 [Porphyridium purpureum]|eukprot:POR3570..scf295_1
MAFVGGWPSVGGRLGSAPARGRATCVAAKKGKGQSKSDKASAPRPEAIEVDQEEFTGKQMPGAKADDQVDAQQESGLQSTSGSERVKEATAAASKAVGFDAAEMKKKKDKDLDKVLRGFGLENPKTQAMRMDARLAQEREEQKTLTERTVNLYKILKEKYSQEQLVKAERGLQVALLGLMLFWIGDGLIITTEAYYKVRQQDVPQSIIGFVATFESLFTPSVVLFLLLSSLYGLYKVNQIES